MTQTEHRIPNEALLDGVAHDSVRALCAFRHHEPHAVLGAHPLRIGRRDGVVVRALHPDAVRAEVLPAAGNAEPMQALGDGLFAAFLADAKLPLVYRLRFHFADGGVWERDDPYRFAPCIGELDLHLLAEGTHRRLDQALGANVRVVDGVAGTHFAVWAPNAQRVSVIGDFCGWDGRLLPMRSMGGSGVFELFVPDAAPGALYQYEIVTREGALRAKTDPLAAAMEEPPGPASRVFASSYEWGDADWMRRRARADAPREPMTIYEAHLGSWARVPEENNRMLSYRELGPRIAEHAVGLGFTHVELLPVAEHAFYGSWGYQVTGYFAPTARYGTPDDLRYFVDVCHQHGLGVIMDWVPAHFPKDDYSLRRFDGTPLYEHEDPRRGEHPDWGTLIFNFGRNEVRSFLISNALYWLREFHIDGLRVDAVASMLYLDYSRKAGEWVPNRYGGRENLDAVELVQSVNRAVAEDAPGALTFAEESTAWPGVTKPVEEGGLGFTFKWNMGWMHDTLSYFEKECVHRGYHQSQLSFAMVYEYSERFVNPLSHDEVVYGKGSMLEKMPGDTWQQFANLRTLLAYQYTRPGKVLLFMGTELAPTLEWNHDRSLDWHLADDPARRDFARYLGELAALYQSMPAFWRQDPDPEGFAWIDASDSEQSVFSYERRAGEDVAVVVLNLTPVPRENYRIGALRPGRWEQRLSSDDVRYGGSGYATRATLEAEEAPFHGRAHSLVLALPPLAALVLAPAGSAPGPRA